MLVHLLMIKAFETGRVKLVIWRKAKNILTKIKKDIERVKFLILALVVTGKRFKQTHIKMIGYYNRSEIKFEQKLETFTIHFSKSILPYRPKNRI